MSNESGLPSEKEFVTLRVRLVLKPETLDKLTLDCKKNRYEKNVKISLIVDDFYERKATNG